MPHQRLGEQPWWYCMVSSVKSWTNLPHKKEPVEDPVGMDCLVPNTVQYGLVLCDVY